jgi:hypothetical protein
VIIVEAPVVPMLPVMAVPVPWLVIPAPPPKTAKKAARPRLGAAGDETDLEEARDAGAMGTAQAPMKAAIVRTATPPRIFRVNVFIVSYLLVQIVYVLWPYVKYYLHIFYTTNSRQ